MLIVGPFEHLKQWTTQAAAVMVVGERLVEYFGTSEEHTSWREASAITLRWLRSLTEVGVSHHVPPPPTTAVLQTTRFSCGASVASVLSPVLTLIMEPEPAFVYLAMRDLPAPAGEWLRTLYAHFLAHFSEGLCQQVWIDHPQLAPQGWPGDDDDIDVPD